MYKRYIVVANTNYIHRDIKPINISYDFCGENLEKATKHLDFEYEFTYDFFQHIRFYEIYFNDKNQPISGHLLGKEEDDFECPNGWIDLGSHLEKVHYNIFFLKKSSNEKFFNSNAELFEKLLEWAKKTAEAIIKNWIIDSIEYGES